MNQLNIYKPIDQLLAALHGGDMIGGAVSPASGFRLDVEETDDAYQIIADMPGVRRENVDISVEDNVLTVGADFSRADGGGAKALLRERAGGRVSRAFRLPRNVDAGGIDAHMQDGVLRLSLPKAPEASKRRIAVR